MININQLIGKQNEEIIIEQKMKIKYINEDINEMERKQKVYIDFGNLTSYREVTRELKLRQRDLKVAEIIYFAATQQEEVI